MLNEVLSEMKGNALVLTFNRPDLGNAFNIDMATQFFNILKNASTDRGIRAVLLRGKGGNFITGLDLRAYVLDVGIGVERMNQMMQPYNSAIREMQAMEKPIVAVVDGSVAGPGMSLMLASDLVLAGRNTKFNCKFTSYGMSPDGGATFLLPRKIGAVKANHLLMLSETIDAVEAERIGLINAVFDDELVQEEALRWVDRLSKTATRAVGATKTLVARAFEQNLNQHLALEHAYWGQCSRSLDFREAIKSMAAKPPRDPKFIGS